MSRSKVLSQDNRNSTSIANEMRQFDRLKKKQEADLLGMVQYEIKQEMFRKENEEKLAFQLEKEKNIKMERDLKNKIEEQKKKMKEKEREDRLFMENEERIKQEQQKFMEEQIKIKEIEEKKCLK